jgi:nitrate/nitrite transporter NarK
MGFGFGSAVLGQITPFMLPKYEKVATLPKEFKASEMKGKEIRSLVLVDLDTRIENEEKKEAGKKDEAWLTKLKAFRKESENKPMTLDGRDVLICTKEGMSVAHTFYILGAVFLILLIVAAQFLNNPPPDWKPPVAVQAKAVAAQPEAKDLSGALSMPQFYILWFVLCINVTAGLAIISNIANMVQNACAVAPLVAGTVIFVTSIFNGLGRIFWASLSDKLGRKGTFMLILGLQIPLFIILPYMSNVVIFSVVACVIYACYGGGFATMPAYTADTFTAKNMGQIYGKILLAWGLAGIVGPMLMQYIKDTYGDFRIAMFMASGLLAVAFIVNLFYRKPLPAPTPQPKPA